VCSRLTVETQDLPVTGSTSPGPGTFASVPKGLIYSPGYNALARAERELITVHDLIHLKTSWPGRAKYLAFYNLVAKPVIRRTGAVITVSETSKREIENWIRDPKVEVVNAGLGASAAFHPGVELVVPDKPYLLYVGNMREHKNLRTAIEAMKHVPDAEMRLLIPASEHAEARAVATAHGVASQMTFLDPLDDDALAIQYRGAAATVMPSTLEGFGLPPLESIMTGTPVIYWAGCSAVAETSDGRGWAVSGARDIEEWGATFAEALSSHTRVSAPIGAYDWDTTAGIVDDVLKRIA
jgi:glycosyltransferase involved in cell wall biosynthesis